MPSKILVRLRAVPAGTLHGVTELSEEDSQATDRSFAGGAQPELDPAVRKRANRAALIYGGLRLLLFIGLTVVIQAVAMLIGAPVPVIMSALLALIVAFPLSMLVFSKQRVEATEAMALWGEQRRARKSWVNDELADR